MGKTVKKYGYIIFMTACFAILCFGIIYYYFTDTDVVTEDADIAAAVEVDIEADGTVETVTLWKSGDGKYYCFLPTYANLNQAYFRLNTKENVSLNGDAVQEGDPLSGIELGSDYTLMIGGGEYTLQFMQSANTATIYIDTISGGVERISSDKLYKEKMNITVYGESGEAEYSQRNYEDTISGRGNSTWSLEKKPFNLALHTETDLLGMGAAQKWVLLANAYDETNIRNKLVYDFAAQIDFVWSPECRFVDLYVNGEYYGLYLLSEKVEIGENRLNISVENSFLFRAEQSEKWDGSTVGFQTDRGREMAVTWPSECSQTQLDVLQERVNLIESLILDDEDNELFAYIDLDSWARRYLIDEVFSNLDAESASAYYYWDASDADSKVYAGPIWDYDFSLGNTNSTLSPLWDTPNRLLSNMSWKIWYKGLMKHEEFKERVVELYTTEYKPLLTDMLDTGIDYLVSKIYAANEMDFVRWEGQLPSCSGSWEAAASAMKNFLQERVKFLDEVWCDDVTYYTVSAVTNRRAYCFEVREGECFQQLPYPAELDVSNFIGWYDETTGEEFDDTLPITEDKVITAVFEADTSTSNAGMLNKIKHFIVVYKYILCVFILCTIFGISGLFLLYTDWSRNKRRR